MVRSVLYAKIMASVCPPNEHTWRIFNYLKWNTQVHNKLITNARYLIQKDRQ